MEHHERKKFALIEFKAENLLYDIRNIAFITGDQMPGQPDEKLRANVQDVDAEGNIDFLRRKMELAFCDIRECLYTYTAHTIRHTEADNDDPGNTRAYTFLLRLPPFFSKTTLRLVKNLIHEYIVDDTLFEWFSIAKKDEAELYYRKRENVRERLRECMEHRIRRKERPLFPPY